MRYLLAAALTALSVFVFWVGWRRSFFLHGARRFSIQSASLTEWKSYGGSWSVHNGVIHNDSDERGAKLVTGDSAWTDYTFRAEIRLDGDHGDMGVIIRSNDEEEGVDAYNGYYVGLRTTDGTLVGGRSNYGWMESHPIPVTGGVHSSEWYRLTVTAMGCDIAAESENLTSRQKTWIAFSETHCVHSGRIGLRSLATGGMWRNLHVDPTTQADLITLEKQAARVGYPEFPKREADYNRFFRFSPAYVPSRARGFAVSEATQVRVNDLLELPRTQQNPVVIRGVVTLTSPGLYVQDATGGVLVEANAESRLNVGDAVEVAGQAHPELYSTVITASSVRQLWPGIPVPPISVTAQQAALGTYDRRFVEVDGRLTWVDRGSDGREVMELQDQGQPFRVVYAGPGISSGHAPRVGSYLRVHGICVLDEKYTRRTTPFALLLRSEDDTYVLAGPPWWTAFHIALLFAGALVLALGGQVAYFRIQRWKTLLVTEERERLAHEIHDTMAQSFAGVGYQLQGIRNSIGRGDCRDWQQIGDQLNVAVQLVRRCHEEASRTVAMLGFSQSEEKQDLLRQLEETAVRIAGGNVLAIARLEGTPSRMDLRVTNALLHIGQEAIANSLRHGNPQTVRITLAIQEKAVQLTIVDDGRGFESTDTLGFGILGMQKRARDIHAELTLESAPGRGTTVRVIAALRASGLRHWLGRDAKLALWPTNGGNRKSLV